MAKRHRNSMKIQLFMFVSLIFPVSMQQEQCYADNNSPYLYFASKTAYHISRGSQFNVPPNCSPIYIWALIRHGARYPNEDFVKAMKNLYKIRDDIIANHKEGRGSLCEKDLENLKKWKTNVTDIDEYYDLTPQGAKDMVFLAQKFKQIFPEFLNSLPKESYNFQSSNAKRTKDSALAFTNELLGTNFTNTDANNIAENENLLHINKNCPRYSNEVKENSSIHREINLFKESEFVQKLKTDISTRLGFKRSLSFEQLQLIFYTCAYENAWYINSKPAFCAAFLPEHLKVFEYAEDLNDYYEKGYGNSFESKMGCVILRDMMIRLSDAAAKDPSGTQKATFYFTHAESIYPLTVKLGLNHDEEPLKYDNYEEMIEGRRWKSHIFNSFTSNIVAVLYRCHGSQVDQNTVIFYQSERQVVPPKCTTNPCTLRDLQQNFRDVFNKTECDLEFCKSNGSTIFPHLILSIFTIKFLFM